MFLINLILFFSYLYLAITHKYAVELNKYVVLKPNVAAHMPSGYKETAKMQVGLLGSFSICLHGDAKVQYLVTMIFYY